MNKLQLSLEIYTPENIEKVCMVYKNLAKTKVKKKRDTIEVIFTKCKYDVEITKKEFENYLINVENMKQ